MTTADPSAYYWRSFQFIKLAAAGMFLIGITSLIAISGYLITPDDTPQANDMLVQLSLKKPGASFTTLKLNKQDYADKVNVLQKMLFGQPALWGNISITSFRFNRDSLYVREYVSNKNVAAETANNFFKIGQVIVLKQVEFVEAARTLGFGNYRIISHHILPNIISPILALAASNFASAILPEIGLSFLGYGAQPLVLAWGAMIKEYYRYIVINSAYRLFCPV